ncbi:signal peptidase I [Cytobacillus firmus]|uniref:Signal peptidase I n=1 Tax=Cytobacillus firmus TaxID=1399 RepID=A0A800N8T6_CYTFI|nr:signal peptidase I [Cytobacillus firmus]KAF0822215.1 Signal peptidase SipW, required for TasA secretion [Cytobacillus firmus]
MKKIMKVLSNALTLLLYLLLITMIFIVISSKASGGEPQIFGNQLKTVLSGSMEPTFKTGSIIVVKPVEDPSALKKEDIITFMEEEGQLVTHRITDVIKSGENTLYKTKGDNNEEADSTLVMAQNVVGEYTGFTFPLVGYFIDFAKSKNGTSLMLILPGLLLLSYSVITIYRALKEIDKPRTPKKIEKTA